ncbi:alpha-galactosidase [Paenibacillus pectinilyticus]|uniref:Alpha-galactosidase n=1 Tax=Paenibacillus pectinilyticus TaxID=512399 RepID=A0A1C0ZVS3_9BACL|nr:alpha-galactosidase [Paenibacillus pectinilyticus]OCT12214.1 alpha-galactosidase [Paenibacillus pectinilyticus]
MPILYDETHQLFHLQTAQTSYAFQVTKWGLLAHLYWGKSVRSDHLHRNLALRARSTVSPRPDPAEPAYSPDTLPQEFPAYGAGDFRPPMFEVLLENGTSVTDLTYRSHRITSGKPTLAGLPATYVESDEEAQTLEIELYDALIGLSVFLTYSVFPTYDAITRSVRFVHNGNEPLRLQRVLTMSVDLPHAEFDFLHLSGAHLRERAIYRRSLTPGGHTVESRRGVSGHQQNPFVALLSKGAGEDQGEVYGFNLVYSGSFLAHAEVDQFFTTRVQMGINPFDFSWLLMPGEMFQSPEAVLVFSDQGLGGMSRIYHRLYRDRLCRGTYRHLERPILINNWEATYFDFDAAKLEQIAQEGSKLGMELFVLDDGWFGKRNDDHSSLGDWVVDQSKLPDGLQDLADRIARQGMLFGLWFEPEMVSPDSDLYRKHPDWCLHVPERRRTESRSQLVLDMSRSDVVEYVVDAVCKVLESAPIAYVKWDLNRNFTEIGSQLLPKDRQRETAHRYMLGLYQTLERITSKFPHILFESCAGGGGRFDPGMLYYMPQTWASDNSDAISRLQIQYGTSLVYPPVTMGANVSVVPNHQIGRTTPLQTRGYVAMSGSFGYQLDLTKLSEEEKFAIGEQVACYKQIRRIVQFGDFYRLLNPFEAEEAAWMFVTEDRQEAVVFYFQVQAAIAGPIKRLRLKGLNEQIDYRLIAGEPLAGPGDSYGGDYLQRVGYVLPALKGDYQSLMFRLTAIESYKVE